VAVKRSQSASRTLAVLESIASHQPIGISAIAKALDEDRSAVQRAVMTLADMGWIRHAAEPPIRWELSAHLFTIAHLPCSSSDLRERARRVLEQLRDETDETAFLAIPDATRFIVIEVAESHHALRMATRVGEVIAPRASATGRAVLPYLDSERQTTMLGRTPGRNEKSEFEATRERGYALSAGDVMPGATNLAAAVFDALGEPMGAIVISGPSERLTPDRYTGIGKLVSMAAQKLSRKKSTATIG
jgi:IclR family acetate operon transcriptional repressor